MDTETPKTQTPARSDRRRGIALLSAIVVGVTSLGLLAFIGLMLRPSADPGIRVWMLNHTPDQAIVVNPFTGQIEKKFLVADGLRELSFSRDGKRAYIASVVDVSNRLTVIDTENYLTADEIEVDGVPQGIGVFPDDDALAIILGSKTDFMAGGFDVVNLNERSTADPRRRVRLYRERDLSLTHKLAIGDDGDRIYCIDAKQSLVHIYSLKARQRIGSVDLNGSPEELLYPPVGDYYYVSVLTHYAVYKLSKATDQVVGAYVMIVRDPNLPWERGRLRHMAVDNTGRYLFVSSQEDHSVGVWRVGDPEYLVSWGEYDPERVQRILSVQTVLNHYLPATRIKLKGGYRPGISYVGGPKQLVVDELNQNLFVVDEDGGLYIYDYDAVLRADYDEVLEPYQIVNVSDGELRDLKVTRASATRRRVVEEDGG